MRRVIGSFLVGSGLIAATACSSSEGSPSGPGTAGSPSGGSSGSPAAGASGASGAGGAAAGGSGGGGGVGGNGGAAGSAGASGSGQGGSSGGGQAGSGGGHSPVRSAGCGKVNPMEGARTLQTGGQTARFNVELPAGYEPDEPMPLGFGFHGFGNDECGPNQGECRGFAMLPAVTVYMKSISDGWEQQGVLEQNITFWRDVLALMKNEYCIDESRVFVAGVSSGGQFIEHLTCRFGDELWQTTAVCAAVVSAATQNCKGTPPALIIHGVTDQAGNYGEGTAAMFAERNGCSETPPAGLAQAKAELMTARNEERAEHRCLDWDGCTANPVRFCLSSQVTYDGLTHGWPQVGGTLIGQFQGTLE